MNADTVSPSLHDRLRSRGPKRILALDGGGVRGMVTLGFLERLESLLRERHHDPDLRLGQYFDLVGGTSVGALLGAGVALGMTTAELRSAFQASVTRAFGRRRVKRWESMFDPKPLKEELFRIVGDRRLDDPDLRSGLCVVAKRADTQSTWLLINHPDAKFFEANRHIPLRDVLYASAAAPLYFVPELVDVGNAETAAFVDGGVSMANNPALQLLLLATLKAYPFRWQRGPEHLMLVSLGTGSWRRAKSTEAVMNLRMWDWARHVPDMLIGDANTNAQLMLQALSESPTRWTIDSEVGDLADDLLSTEPLLWYLRYDVKLEREQLQGMGMDELAPDVARLRDLGNAGNAGELLKIGRVAANAQIRGEHFPPGFDL